MGQQKRVLELGISRVKFRFAFEDVQPRGRDPAAFKGGNQVLVHHQATTSSVDQDRSPWQ
jgi:hypothetical protein